ncbi:MAG: hypothetical protein NUV69_00835 [Candidatus Curtissbacteria bacterium]|nr:hypothetical protein [Candidatus Curtissbacteria bacterium]
MSAQEFFYYSLGAGTIVLIAVILLVAVQVVATLRIIRKVLTDVKSTTKDVIEVKEGIKMGIAGLIGYILKTLRRGGEAHV